MIALKESVRFDRIDDALWKGILMFHRLYLQYSDTMTITSLQDGRHGGTSGYDESQSPPSNSRHYLGLAVDIRSKTLSTTDKNQLLADASVALSGLGSYYLILEWQGTGNEHYHLQVGKF